MAIVKENLISRTILNSLQQVTSLTNILRYLTFIIKLIMVIFIGKLRNDSKLNLLQTSVSSHTILRHLTVYRK